jgi:RNA-directed DNA polymerase
MKDNERSSSEYNNNNAYVVMLSSGSNTNGNKYNPCAVRPVAESQTEAFQLSEEQRLLFLKGMHDAYIFCKAAKSSSKGMLAFLPYKEIKLYNLCNAILERRYEPKPLTVFIVEKPQKREVYASDFGDRIVDTYAYLRVERLLNRVLPDNATSCRVGLGMKAANDAYVNAIEECSEHRSKDCWMMTYDARSYYMTIEKQRLMGMWNKLIDDYYDDFDKEIIKYVIGKRLMADPRMNCKKGCKDERWIGLPPHKSLFNIPAEKGIVIGMLITNISANLYMQDIDRFVIQDLGFAYYGRNIDDCWIVCDDKDRMLAAMPLIRKKYEEYGLTLHPNKFQLQHYTKGLKVLNMVYKNGRRYSSQRPLTNCAHKIHWYGGQSDEYRRTNAVDFMATINSYLGMLVHFNEFKNRKRICEAACKACDAITASEDFTKVVVKQRFTTKEKYEKKIKKIKNKYKRYERLSNQQRVAC